MNRFADDDRAPEPAGSGAPDGTAADPPAGGEGAGEPVREDPRPGHDADAEELAFLERSLADLDAEKSAGDITGPDYRSLSSLYAERLAAVRRRAGRGAAAASGTRRDWRRPWRSS